MPAVARSGTLTVCASSPRTDAPPGKYAEPVPSARIDASACAAPAVCHADSPFSNPPFDNQLNAAGQIEVETRAGHGGWRRFIARVDGGQGARPR